MYINKYNIMRDNKHDGLMQFIHGFVLLYDEYANDSMNIHDIEMNFNECKSCWDCKDAWRHMINAALIE